MGTYGNNLHRGSMKVQVLKVNKIAVVDLLEALGYPAHVRIINSKLVVTKEGKRPHHPCQSAL